MSPEIQKHVAHLREVIARQAHDIEILSREIATTKGALITEIIAREAAEKSCDKWEELYNRLKIETGVMA